jgi:hypothetical protein
MKKGKTNQSSWLEAKERPMKMPARLCLFLSSDKKDSEMKAIAGRLLLTNQVENKTSGGKRKYRADAANSFLDPMRKREPAVTTSAASKPSRTSAAPSPGARKAKVPGRYANTRIAPGVARPVGTL